MNKGFLRDNLLTFGTKMLAVAFTLAFNAVVGRLLGPEGKGVAALATMVVAYLGTVGTMGVDYAVIQMIGQDRAKLRKGVAAMIWTGVVVSVIVCAVLWFFRSYRANIGLGSLNDTMWALTVLGVPLAIGAKIIQETFRSRHDFVRYNMFEAGKGLFAALGAVLLVWIIPLGNVGAVATAPFRMGLVLLIGLAILYKAGLLHLKTELGLWKRLLSFGLKSNIGQSLQFLNYRLDAFIVAYFLGSWGVGIYTAAVGLAEMIWFVSGSVSLVLFPKSAQLDHHDAARLAAQTARITQFFSFVLAALLAALGWLAIWIIYGPKFAPAYLPLVLILPGVWFFGYGKLSVSYLMGRGRPLHGTWLTLLSLVLIVPLDLFVIPIWGVSGASVASTIVYSLGGLLGLFWFKKYSGLRLKDFLWIRKQDLVELASALRRK